MKPTFALCFGLMAITACSLDASNTEHETGNQGGGGSGHSGGSGPGGGGPGGGGGGGGQPSIDCAKDPGKCYVRVENGQFTLDGKPYRYMGTNFWAAPYISGDRLGKELDMLQSQGIKNLRIMALSEGDIPDSQKNDPKFGPQRITPASSDKPCADPVLDTFISNLKHVLDEVHAHGMKAVLTLNDWYHWSGGMPQYMKWSYEQPNTACIGNYDKYLIDGPTDPMTKQSLLASGYHVPFQSSALFKPGVGDHCDAAPVTTFTIPHPNTYPAGSADAGKAWDDQQDISTLFLCNKRAQEFFFSRAKQVVKALKDHPGVMAWQLANEPRSFKGWSALFKLWVQKTSQFIKDIDPNHLISIGSEGELYMWGDYANSDYREFHDVPTIDYMTFHVWPENWGWYDPTLPIDSMDPTSLTKATQHSNEYIQIQLEHAKALGKPTVMEEFGLARDDKSSPVTSTVTKRNKFYEAMFKLVRDTPEAGGINFWAWAGTGRPAMDGNPFWRLGNDYLGDPPHEQQGWYSVYSSDKDTLALIAMYAEQINKTP